MRGRKADIPARLARAQHMKRMYDRGIPTLVIAGFYELSQRTIDRELKWLRERQTV